ncbi:MAG: redoxin domain-containing protein [Deltaproteobacteria bacterium]|nr:redoxin domain-containing protein [Deltaproteobacteria bacterium]
MKVRKRFIAVNVILCILNALITMGVAAAARPVEIDQPAPPFTATDIRGSSIRLSDYMGRNVILVFYIGHR